MTAITPRIRHANDPWRDWVDIPTVTATDTDTTTLSLRAAVRMVRRAIGNRATVVAVTHALAVGGPQHAIHVMVRDVDGDHIVPVPYHLAMMALCGHGSGTRSWAYARCDAFTVSDWVRALDVQWGWHP